MSEKRFKFGIHLNHEFEKGSDTQAKIDQLIRYTHTARDLGLDSILGMHHYLSSLETIQPLPLLARLIPESGDMRLGIGIYLFYEHPVMLAENWATIDQLSGGRLIMGLGAGYRPNEFEAMGMEREKRVSRMFEGIEVSTKQQALWLRRVGVRSHEPKRWPGFNNGEPCRVYVTEELRHAGARWRVIPEAGVAATPLAA